MGHLFLRSSTGPNRAFEPRSLRRVRDPVRIAAGQTHDFGFSILDFGLRTETTPGKAKGKRQEARGKRQKMPTAVMPNGVEHPLPTFAFCLLSTHFCLLPFTFYLLPSEHPLPTFGFCLLSIHFPLLAFAFCLLGKRKRPPHPSCCSSSGTPSGRNRRACRVQLHRIEVGRGATHRPSASRDPCYFVF